MAKELASALKMEKEAAKDCRIKFNFSIAASDVASEADRATREFASYAAVPGFRKGHAPAAILRKNYAPQIREELKRRLFSAAFDLLNADKDLDMLSCSPENAADPEFSADYSFSLVADVVPAIELGDYKKLEIKVEPKAVSDADVEERVKAYRSMYANYADTAEPIAKEDMLKVSYTSDCKLPEDAPTALKRMVECENNYLWLNEPEMIPGSTEALIGAKVGDEREVVAVYPADFHEAALAGKTVKYKVKVLAVQRRAALDDAALCEKVKAPSIEEFRKVLKSGMEREAESEAASKRLDAAWDKLDSQIKEFELPAAFVESDTARELRKIADQSVKSEADAEAFKKDIEAHKKAAGETARKALRRMLVLRKIAKLENISVDDRELSEQINAMSRYYGYKGKEFAAMLEKSGAIDELRMNVLGSKVLAFIAGEAKK